MTTLATAEARAAAWLAAWDAQGVHRTGTAGDAAAAEWLAREAAVLGVAAGFEKFGFDRLDPVAARLEIAGAAIPAVPVFDAPATDMDGVAGRLGLAPGASEIAVAELSPHAVYGGEFERLRRGGGHRGLVVLCRGAAPGMALLNAEAFRAPYGAPAIQIASEARERVLAAAAVGAPARLVAASRRVAAEAANVVAVLQGSDPSAPPLVAMTPRSSWWQSTAERGGGLVCWLETLRALVAAPPACDVVLTATSGHELGHLGLDDFLARRPGWDGAGGARWIHYGANIGAAGGSLSVQSANPALRAAAGAALAEVECRAEMAPPERVPSGETRDIHRAGGAYVTLVGSNRLFHLPQDRWPHAVDVGAVAAVAAAAARLVITLTR